MGRYNPVLPVDDPGVVFDIDTQSDYDFRVE